MDTSPLETDISLIVITEVRQDTGRITDKMEDTITTGGIINNRGMDTVSPLMHTECRDRRTGEVPTIHTNTAIVDTVRIQRTEDLTDSSLYHQRHHHPRRHQYHHHRRTRGDQMCYRCPGILIQVPNTNNQRKSSPYQRTRIRSYT